MGELTMEDLRSLQMKEYEILKELDRVCKQNDIQYFLFAGTLIGALRHNGFIPWDDDLDTAMTLQNYKKFQEACKNGALKEGFFLQSPETQPESGLNYCKLRMDNTTLIIDYLADKDIHHGINIDVYPLYKLADGFFERIIQYISGAFYLLMTEERAPENHGLVLRIGSKIILKILRFKKLREKIKKICLENMEKYEGSNTKYRINMHGNTSLFKYHYKAEDFERTTLHKFENDEFPIPEGYDDYLSCYYHDYMKLPPENQRGIKMKDIVYYDTRRSYMEYKGKYYCVDNSKSKME